MIDESGKYLVIGSNAFTAGHFIQHILADGAQVIGISRSPLVEAAYAPFDVENTPAFAFHQLDLNRDLSQIKAIIADFRPRRIVNFAAQSMASQSWDNPAQCFQTHVVSAVALHDFLRQLPYLKSFVQVSTPEVYGHCHGIVDEQTPFNPTTPYAVSKAAIDMSLQTFHKAYGFPVVFTRAATVFGPCQPVYRLIPRTVMAVLQGRRLPLPGGGLSVRSFVHASDVADATARVALNGEAGSVYHLSTDRYTSIRDVVHLVCEMMGEHFEDVVQFTDDRVGKDQAYRLSCEKIQRELNWYPRRSLEQGVADTIAWARTHEVFLKQQPVEYVYKP